MSPEKSKIFLVDDDRESIETNTEYLKIGGHIVVETAYTLAEALSKIHSLGEKG